MAASPPASRWFLLFCTALLLLSSSPSAQLAAAPLTTVALSSDPATASATLVLGEQRSLSLMITNSGSEELQPLIREAYPPQPAATFAKEPAGPGSVSPPAQSERVDPQLDAELAASPDASTEIMIFLATQADLSAAYAISSWRERGDYVYRTLRDHAAQTQRPLRSWLSARGVAYTPLWMVNALVVRGDAALRDALAARGDVLLLRANRTAELATPVPPTVQLRTTLQAISSCDVDANNVCWNIRNVKADQVWRELGVLGQGVVVANIDSGVRYDHPALIANYRGNLGSESFDHNYNWVDFSGDAAMPRDAGDHGTHTMGTMVARGVGSDQPAVGVAPSAQWIAARACSTSLCSEFALMQAAQWMLAPTDLSGDNPRPDLRPQIINNSWANGEGGRDWYAGYTAAWRAAGIFPVFVIGNGGSLSGCGSAESPGDYADVVGVGAIGKDDRLTSFSTIGPTSDGRVKPDLTAPGSGIASTGSASGLSYVTKNGTSMAAPHVAGAVALLWSANPSLVGNYAATLAALTASARPLTGDSRFQGSLYANCLPEGVPNNIYGHGALDTYASVQRVLVDLPWLSVEQPALAPLAAGAQAELRLNLDARRVPGPGTYQARILIYGTTGEPPLSIPVSLEVPADPLHAALAGQISAAESGSALAASIAISAGAQVRSDRDGRYRLSLPAQAATYSVTASATGYVSRTTTITVTPGLTTTLDLALALDRPRLSLAEDDLVAELAYGQSAELPLVLSNTGTDPLTYTASPIEGVYGLRRSDEPGSAAATWVTPPADAVELSLADDGFSAAISLGFPFTLYDRSYEFVYIGSNGLLSFGAPTTTGSFLETCMPIRETSGAAIVPLHIDLDPTLGGRISYARLAEGFLVSYEGVALHSTPDRRLTFQVLLHRDGRVLINYGNLPLLAASDWATAGVQRTSADAQSLGCGSELAITQSLSLEYLPQPLTSAWLSVNQPSGVIAEGQAADLRFRVSWVDSPLRRPLLAEILIASSDPDRPSTRLRVRLVTLPAAHRLYLVMMRK
jgi:subtilisin family serine protease